MAVESCDGPALGSTMPLLLDAFCLDMQLFTAGLTTTSTLMESESESLERQSNWRSGASGHWLATESQTLFIALITDASVDQSMVAVCLQTWRPTTVTTVVKDGHPIAAHPKTPSVRHSITAKSLTTTVSSLDSLHLNNQNKQ